MKQRLSSAFQPSVILLALLTFAQLAQANDGQGRAIQQAQQTASEASPPTHLRWMLDQHWRVVHWQLR